MEILTILAIVFFGIIFLKLMGLFLNVGIFLISIPLKILAFLLSTLFVVFFLVPFGILSALVAIPLIFIAGPVILIGAGILFLLRNI